ncbi:MAG: serine hydrolase domain-containing protein [Candidatus Hydrogenedentes bacterium]|nr:serine hydrolase domain-containing protein [Candidatus Hydrogenedentota bacterium]
MNGGVIGNPEESGIDRDGLEGAIRLLEKQRDAGLHDGAQLFVARNGNVVLDVAIGEARPGVPLTTGSVMLWYSSTKPLTAVAIAQQLERGKLKLDERVQSIIPEFANGKESATIKHILTHTGGFPMNDFPFLRYDWDSVIQSICDEQAEYEPGTAAGYHPLSGWCILGEIVRRLDGRPIEVYLDEEIFGPLGMMDTSLGISAAREAELGHRLSSISEKTEPLTNAEAWNDPRARPRILPGGSGYGSAHDLGKFYLALWNGGECEGLRILKKETVDLFTSTHRSGMVDRTFSSEELQVSPPWGLGFSRGTDAAIDSSLGRRSTSAAYGHGGMRSSVGFVEPSRDLVVTIIANGLPSEIENTRRLCEISDTIHNACT